MVNEEVGQHLNNYYYYDTSWGHITNTIIQEIQPKVGGGLIFRSGPSFARVWYMC